MTDLSAKLQATFRRIEGELFESSIDSRPLHAALIECVSALDFYSRHHHRLNTTAPNFANEALTALARACGEGD